MTRGDGESWSAMALGFHGGWSSSHPSRSTTKYVSDSQPGSQYHATKSNPMTDPNHLTRAEIDFSDVVWNTLGMTDNDLVTVTFNWVYN